MTTPPPTPPGPPAPSDQTTSSDTGWASPAAPRPEQDGRRPWWTGGRVVAAIVIVLVLMGLSAAGGFVAGAAWGGFSGVVAELEGGVEGGFDGVTDSELGSGEGVPGFTPLDTEVADGDDVRPGDRVTGVLSDRPVEHPLTVDSSSEVRLEVVEAEFDSVLVLLDAGGAVLATDDDGGRDTLSAIDASLEPGTYAVRVQSWSGDEVGGYTLVAD